MLEERVGKMAVLLVNLFNFIPGASSLKKAENLGIAYIASCLHEDNIECEVIDCEIQEKTFEDVINMALDDKFELIGISMPYQDCFKQYINFLKQLRKAGVKKPVVIGGHPSTFLYKEILENYREIDFVSIGEGEYTIPELVKTLHENGNLHNVKGIAFRDSKGTVIKNQDRDLIQNLDELPWPYRYIFNEGNKKDIRPSILTSRGCFANCSFCDIQSYYGKFHGNKWRPRSAKDVVDEMEQLIIEHNIDEFYFADDEFIGPGKYGKERAAEIANLIIERNFKIRFTFSTRVNTIEYDLFKKLKEAGLTSVFIGVESGVDSMLKYLNKGITVEQIKIAIGILEELDLNYSTGSILIGPFTNISELRESINFWSQTTGFSLKCYNNLSIYAGTQVYEDLMKNNMLIKNGFKYSYDHIMDSNVLKFRNIMDGKIVSFFTELLLEFQKYAENFTKQSGIKKKPIFMKKYKKIMMFYQHSIFYDCFTRATLTVLNNIEESNVNINVAIENEFIKARSLLYEMKEKIENGGKP